MHGKQRTKNRPTLPVVVAVAQQRNPKALSARVYKTDAGSGHSISSNYMHLRLVLKVAEGAQEIAGTFKELQDAQNEECAGRVGKGG